MKRWPWYFLTGGIALEVLRTALTAWMVHSSASVTLGVIFPAQIDRAEAMFVNLRYIAIALTSISAVYFVCYCLARIGGIWRSSRAIRATSL